MSSPDETTVGDAGASPFDAIVFDVGGLLITHENDVMYRQFASRCRTPYTPDQVRALMRQTRWSTGAQPMSAFHEQLRREAGYQGDWDDFVPDLCCHFGPVPSMIAFVERLAAHNRVILFSNTVKEHWDYLDNMTDGALNRFERYLSHEIGQAKPSPDSFHHMAALASITPARSIFFDDLIENVEGAREAGFQAYVFESEEQLATLLTAAGVRLA